jgi:hypothetical protein
VTLEWTRQYGSSADDTTGVVAADVLGNVFIVGYTRGDVGGPNAGDRDAFVIKYDSAGNFAWARQHGSSSYDFGEGVAADGMGNVFIGGTTLNNVGGPSGGHDDAFLFKYDGNGNVHWSRQFGTPEGDQAHAVSADDHGNVYIVGATGGSLGGPWLGSADAFLVKFAGNGDLIWSRQFGTAFSETPESVFVDRFDNVYVSGRTTGSLGGANAGESDAFVSKFDEAGNLVWSRQIGTSRADASEGVVADGLGNIYIAGYTYGSLDGPRKGQNDAFLARFSDTGDHLWTRQLGTSYFDYAAGVAADAFGNVYIAGTSGIDLTQPASPYNDAFASKYDGDGNLLQTWQWGPLSYEESSGIATDGLGNFYVGGRTGGSIGGTSGGNYDAYLMKFHEKLVPEPSSISMAAIVSYFVILRGFNRRSRLLR